MSENLTLALIATYGWGLVPDSIDVDGPTLLVTTAATWSQSALTG